jgi:hypothetical protein
MNTTIGSFRPCWERADDDCLLPALPASLWCAKHAAWAQRAYDPGMDALNARRNLPPSYPQSEIANRESQIANLPSPGSGEGSGVRAGSAEPPEDDPGTTPGRRENDPRTTGERDPERDPSSESGRVGILSFPLVQRLKTRPTQSSNLSPPQHPALLRHHPRRAANRKSAIESATLILRQLPRRPGGLHG